MKILFFTRLFYPHVGGIEKHLEKISEILIEQGYEVTVLTTNHNDKLKKEDIYKGIKIIRFHQPKIKFIGLFYTWLWLFKNRFLIKESDILHVHDVFIWYFPFKFIFPRRKVFLTMHGWEGKYPIPLYNKLLKKISAKLSDANIAIGKFIEKYYSVKADIITYGAVEITNSEPKFKKNIVYVGRLDKDIALAKAFEIFGELEGYHIDFCGDGELKEIAKEYGVVHGFIDPGPYYKKARYCFASGYLTILEALVHKCLVFTLYEHPLQEDYYKLTPFTEFIKTSDDPDSIYKEIKYYEKNDVQAEEIINKGFDWASKQTWEKMVKNYLKLWKKV